MPAGNVKLLDLQVLCGELLLDLGLVTDDLLQLDPEESKKLMSDQQLLRTWLEQNY